MKKYKFEKGQQITTIYKIIDIDAAYDEFKVKCIKCGRVHNLTRKQVTDRLISNPDYCGKCPKTHRERRLSGARASTNPKDRALTELDRKALNSRAFFG